MGWLKIIMASGHMISPKRDVYEEIYLQRSYWWALINDYHINPSDISKHTMDKDWRSYVTLMKDQVMPFHVDISRRYHAHSYAFFGASQQHAAWGSVTWRLFDVHVGSRAPGHLSPEPQRVMRNTTGASLHLLLKATCDRQSKGLKPNQLRTKVLDGQIPMTYVVEADGPDEPGDGTLLPSNDYGMEWLHVKADRQMIRLPKDDVYQEIYLQRHCWWALIHDELINPSDTNKQTMDVDWHHYADLVDTEVKTFHKAITHKYHPTTYAFYGASPVHKAWGEITWTLMSAYKTDQYVKNAASVPAGLAPIELDYPADLLLNAKIDHHFANGGADRLRAFRKGSDFYIYFLYQLSRPDDLGDGTVPVRSGNAPIGRKGVKACVPFDCEHEPAFGGKPNDERTPAMTPAEQNVVEEIKSDLVERCFGRYVMKVPKQAQMRSRAVIDDVVIQTAPMSLAEYQRALLVEASRVRNAKHFKGYQFLYEDAHVPSLDYGHYFITLEDEKAMTDSPRLIKAYNWSNGYQIVMSIVATESKHSKYYGGNAFFADDPIYNTVDKEKSRILRLLRETRGRAADVVPREQGVCLDGAFVEGRQRASEVLSFYFVIPDRPDISFEFETNTDTHSEDRLLLRGRQIDAMLASKENGRTLRKGVVQIPATVAEEWLVGGVTPMDVDGYKFLLEANRLSNPLSYPVVSVEMQVGFSSWLLAEDASIDKASLNEPQAMSLWDAVTRSLRPLPHAFEAL
uniref:Uncharacterized protein n=1 Tax=Mycena chlorophos TaxID=658473 RepID=A0ABQ0LJB0_MYCCL|nr:predicted protein [Mycena chlorophos]